jgi:hypothetical protein
MDFPTIQANLNDLPGTFTRLDQPYTQWIDALSAGLLRGCSSSDAIQAQASSFQNANFGWADTWGAVFNLQRRPGEATPTYKTRVQNTLLANHVTPTAMLNWLATIENITALITENLPNVGYSITLPATLSLPQILMIVANLANVRPAGVPFTVNSQAIGSYLDTVDFFDAARVTGSYLGAGVSAVTLGLTGGTNNATPLLPDLLLIDPTINPGQGAL